MKLNLKTLSITIPVIFCSTALILHGYLGHFSRYMADDFCTVFYAQRLGVFRAAWFWYITWSGRYSASVLDAMIGSLGPKALPFIVPLTIILWVATLTAAFLTILPLMKNRTLVSLALATTSLFSLFLLAPDIRQSLYWGQGMRSVVPPLVMGTIQIILLNQVRSRDWSRFQLGLWGTLSLFWAFVAGGFSETYAAFQVAAFLFSLTVILVVEKFKFSNTSLFLASGLLGAIGALSLIVLAPGNSERQAFFPPPPGLGGILSISLKSFFGYLVSLANTPDKILASLGLFSLAVMIGSQVQRERDARLLVVIPGIMLGFMFVCFPPAAYGTSDAPPGRTLILPTYFFLIGLLALGFVCGNLLGKEQDFIHSAAPRRAALAFSKLLPSLVIVTTILSASIHSINLYESRSEFVKYAAIWDETDANILKSKQTGAAQVLIPATANWASLNIPNDNPRFWVNLCMSSYYDIQILAVPNSSLPSP
jgi:hypothetical protein